MAKIFSFEAFRRKQQADSEPKPTRNQELLTEINNILASRTPEERRKSEVKGIQESMGGLQRRLEELTAEGPQAEEPKPVDPLDKARKHWREQAADLVRDKDKGPEIG